MSGQQRSDEELLEHVHAAHQAGYRLGYAAGQMAASVDLARTWLHDDARRWTEQAVRTAEVNHGPGWASLIREQAEAVAG